MTRAGIVSVVSRTNEVRRMDGSWASILSALARLLRRCPRLAQIAIEPIEARVPEATIALRPFRDGFERSGFEPTRPALRIATASNQARTLEHFEVFGNRRQAHGERLGQLGHRALAARESAQNSAPRRIG